MILNKMSFKSSACVYTKSTKNANPATTVIMLDLDGSNKTYPTNGQTQASTTLPGLALTRFGCLSLMQTQSPSPYFYSHWSVW